MSVPMQFSRTIRLSRAISTASCLLGSLVFLNACAGGETKWAENSSPQVRVNQHGYLPQARKFAVVRSETKTPLEFKVFNEQGDVVLKGMSRYFGPDVASGDTVHQVDFSTVTTEGKYKIEVGSLDSFEFEISSTLYTEMKYEALSYFYMNRSGIALTLPYAKNQKWTRNPGHMSDTEVGCADGCNYKLNVAGGWYDAGDYGKYVVNGGISLWTMLNQYERAVHLGRNAADFADNTMLVPEQNDGIPDILDESRWELEFMIKMQVPAGQPLAGMVHHKVHDGSWSALAVRPAYIATNRYLHPPSTAATLNMVATAAQGARIWKTLDPAFSNYCLAAALRGWDAARKNPEVYAPERDNMGGGPYDDKDATDEFYWAAAELYITLGDASLLTFLEKSPYFKEFSGNIEKDVDGTLSSMTWQSTAALGTMSLLVAPSNLPDADRQQLTANLLKHADKLSAAVEKKEGYRLPVTLGKDGKYPWGSNSVVLNNSLVLMLAHDLSAKKDYLDSGLEGLDYLLGRNPLQRSYITEYGENPFKKPHHRFWAGGYHPYYPNPPPGVVSGGPNSSIQDPTARRYGLKGCVPQKCYIDHAEAWSVNEVAINWNAPLAWITAYADEFARYGVQTEAKRPGASATPAVLPTPVEAAEPPDKINVPTTAPVAAPVASPTVSPK